MAFDDDLKDNLLGPERSRRPFWWNGVLVLIGLAVVVTIIAGINLYRRGGRDATPEWIESAAEVKSLPAEKPAPVAVPAPTAPRRPVSDVTDRLALERIEKIRAIRAEGDLLAAREQCYELLGKLADIEVINTVKDIIGEINIQLITTPAAMPEKVEYVIKSGDILARIARQFGTTVELIRQSNGLRGDLIRVGDRLRVFSEPFNVRVSKDRNILDVYVHDRFFKRYRVGTGKHGTTPLGVFVIQDKIAEPPWWRPDGGMVPFGDEENVLGTRWMSLTPIEDTPPVRGYGIHGTWEPETIGHQASAGCVRLINEQVEELYMLLPSGTRVVIEE